MIKSVKADHSEDGYKFYFKETAKVDRNGCKLLYTNCFLPFKGRQLYPRHRLRTRKSARTDVDPDQL